MTLAKCYYDDCYLKQCLYCGNIVISTWCNSRCCICDSGNLRIIPFTDHRTVSFEWLENRGFSYIKERLEVSDVV